jgi:hypothetical protein
VRVNCSLMSISHGSSASRRWSRMHVHVHRVLAYRGTRGNSWSYSDIRTTSLLLYLTHWKHQILYSCLLFISGGLYSCLRSTHIYSCMCQWIHSTAVTVSLALEEMFQYT